MCVFCSSVSMLKRDLLNHGMISFGHLWFVLGSRSLYLFVLPLDSRCPLLFALSQLLTYVFSSTWQSLYLLPENCTSLPFKKCFRVEIHLSLSLSRRKHHLSIYILCFTVSRNPWTWVLWMAFSLGRSTFQRIVHGHVDFPQEVWSVEFRQCCYMLLLILFAEHLQLLIFRARCFSRFARGVFF